MNIKLIVSHGIHCHQLTWGANGKCSAEVVPELIADHEEADTHLILHAKHASDTCIYSCMVIRSPDTDVAIICLRFSQTIPKLYFQTGKRNVQQIILIDSMAEVLGTDICKSLIGLHVYSGCDSTSAFYGKGKRKAYDMMKSDPKFIQCFAGLGKSFTASLELAEDLMQPGTSRSVLHQKRAYHHVKMPCCSILKDVLIKLPYITGHFKNQ